MLRVSESTSSFSEVMLLKPRELTAQLLAVCSPTWMPGTRRSASGRVVAPDRRMISGVTTATAAAASRRDSSVRETEVTSTVMSSSKLMRLSDSRGGVELLFASAHGAASAPQMSTPDPAMRTEARLALACIGVTSGSLHDPMSKYRNPLPNKQWGFSHKRQWTLVPLTGEASRTHIAARLNPEGAGNEDETRVRDGADGSRFSVGGRRAEGAGADPGGHRCAVPQRPHGQARGHHGQGPDADGRSSGEILAAVRAVREGTGRRRQRPD